MSETYTVAAAFDKKADDVIAKYPEKRSASLPLLHLVQEKDGHICKTAIEWIAEKLELQPVNIYELVTFYPMLREKAIGRNDIKICRTLSCALNGGPELCKHTLERLQTGLDEITEDGEFTVSYVECIAACGTAPVCMINDDFYENVSTDQMNAMIEKYRGKK